MMVKQYVELGKRYKMLGCFSEVMMHFRLDGTPIEVELVPSRTITGKIVEGRFMAQVYHDGKPFSAPILPSEAGLYIGPYGGYFFYVPESMVVVTA